MEVTIKGDVKEIASLVKQLQERQGFNVVKEVPAGKHQALPEAPAGQSRQEELEAPQVFQEIKMPQHSYTMISNKSM